MAASIFRNARIILPDAIRDDLELVVHNGRISELRPRSDMPGAIDMDGNYLAPGFVDLHVHGAFGRDTMEASANAFSAICDFHARGGTTSLLLTTATAPFVDILAALSAVRDASIPQIAGVHMEGPFISREKAGAQNAAFICPPMPALVRRLLENRDVIRRITIAPEVEYAPEAIAQFAGAGINVSGGHSDCWDEQARTAFQRGMRSVTHTFNCMSSARRRGIHRVAGMLEFALSEPAISCELIADGHHVSPTLMRMVYWAKGALGICLVTDATAGAGLASGTTFRLGGRECVLENGACLLADKTALAGSAATMIELVRTMVRDADVPLHEAIAMASSNPAREIGLTAKGQIAAGNDADLVVLSPELLVKQVFVAGQAITTPNASGT
ncbi:MAG: N-acetylglucosamine-6-phosphate deacetylase [Verrucomicrobia bacterium]|nr:N-acetylglucosamine-6-phosphate deacetylase [Verrucomicrobiota bacterium]